MDVWISSLFKVTVSFFFDWSDLQIFSNIPPPPHFTLVFPAFSVCFDAYHFPSFNHATAFT